LLRGRRTKKASRREAAARAVRERRRVSLGPVVVEPKPKGVVWTVIVGFGGFVEMMMNDEVGAAVRRLNFRRLGGKVANKFIFYSLLLKEEYTWVSTQI
jgi:hypothetical protein